MRKALAILLCLLVFPVVGRSQYLPIQIQQQFNSLAGTPLAAGTIRPYICGTTTPRGTFSNSTGTANSAIITLDGAGRANIYITPAVCYDFEIRNAAGSQIDYRHNFFLYAGGGGGGSGAFTSITGTVNQIYVSQTTGPDPVLSLPQDIGPGNSPTFNTVSLGLTAANKIPYTNASNQLISLSTLGFDGTTLTAPASTFQTPTGNTSMKLGALLGSTAYNMISLNGSLSGSLGVGWSGGATADSGMYGLVPATGVISFNFGGVAATRSFVYETGILTKRPVEINTAVAASPHVITVDESGKTFSNETATAKNYHTLPPAAANLQYSFYISDLDGMRIVAAAGDVLRMASVVSGVAGYLDSIVIGSFVTVRAMNATDWVAETVTGAWDVSP
jgi:hypothetical protein